MLTRPFVRSHSWKVLRVILSLSLLTFSGTYVLLGDHLFSRVGHLVAGAARHVSDASLSLRLSMRAGSLHQAHQDFDDLLSSRDALEQQIRALEAKRAEVATRNREDAATLQAILSVLQGKAVLRAGQAPTHQVERDADEVSHRVQVHRSELEFCDAELSRMSEALRTLDRKIADLRCLLEHRTDELQRQKVTHTGWKAYADGLEVARRLEDAERTCVRQPYQVSNP